MSFLDKLFSKEKKPNSVQGEGSAGNVSPVISKHENWVKYTAELNVAGLTGKDLPPQLCIHMTKLSMAKAFNNSRPGSSDVLLTEPPEILEFQDGSGAVCYKILGEYNIRRVLDLLQGIQSFSENVMINGGAVVKLPDSDKSYLLQRVGAQQHMEMGSVIVW